MAHPAPLAPAAPATSAIPGAVLSDLDGTLLTTEDSWRRVVTALIRRRGVTPSAELLARVEGSTIEQSALLVHHTLALTEPLGVLVAELEQFGAAELNSGVSWCEGAPELLAALTAHRIPLALVTSSPRSWVDAIAKQLDFTVFDTIVTADDVTTTKPDPEPYRVAASRLGVDARDCIALEDSLPGMTAAQKAGCHTIVVRPHAADWQNHAHDTVRSLVELTPTQLITTLRKAHQR